MTAIPAKQKTPDGYYIRDVSKKTDGLVRICLLVIINFCGDHLKPYLSRERKLNR